VIPGILAPVAEPDREHLACAGSSIPRNRSTTIPGWTSASLTSNCPTDATSSTASSARLPGAGAVMTDQHKRVLLLWRHRFITDTWGWEIPVGRAEPGESLAEAAAREAEEETGWRPGPLRPLLTVQPTPGISTSVHHIYRADTATRIGAPEDDFESSRIDWVPLATIPELISAGEISSATTLAALLYTIVQDGPGSC
jgi:8-oxo-dGTP pyrophosphatase MutT (NUDIX family)